jgi:hypothetical protein|uniref:hypothetical protein n=1 Tax=Prosthecobacter sp. TaxID=1965333 RepID=UPI00378477D5
MSLRKRHIALGALFVLLPLGTRKEMEDRTAAMRSCLTWATMRISPYVLGKPSETTRWLSEKVIAGAHEPVWWLFESNNLWLQLPRHGPPPGHYPLRTLFWDFYQQAGEREKEQVIATARRYFDASDSMTRSAIFDEAYEKWVSPITRSQAAPRTDLR